MITLLLQLVIVAIILGLVVWLVSQVPFLAAFAQIIRVVAIVLFIVYILYILMSLIGGHIPLR